MSIPLAVPIITALTYYLKIRATARGKLEGTDELTGPFVPPLLGQTTSTVVYVVLQLMSESEYGCDTLLAFLSPAEAAWKAANGAEASSPKIGKEIQYLENNTLIDPTRNSPFLGGTTLKGFWRAFTVKPCGSSSS